MHIEVTRAQSLVEGIEEEKQRIQGSANCVEKPVSEKDFEQHLKKTEDVFVELERTVREMRATMESESAARLAEIEQKDATTRHEIKDLKEKVEEAIARLEEASGCNQRSNDDVSSKLHAVDDLMQDMKSLESKISETALAQVEAAEKVTECLKKVRKLESMQLNTASSVEEVQASTGDLQKSASMWLQKYDAAARLLQDLEKRTLTLESNFSRGGGEHPEDKLDHVDLSDNMQPVQKERLINLYGELSGFVQRMKAHEGGQDDDKDGNGWTPLDTRLVSLENRVAQVETETLSNLRVLDAKMEDFSVGVQTALEGASMAESKCSALGGELVKLFRMIATTRKESPSKMMMMMDAPAGVDESNNEQQHTQQHHHHQQQQPPSRSGRSVAVKGKGQTACNYCKKAATKGNSGDNNVEGERGDGGHNHAGLPETYPSTADGNRMNNFYSNEAGDMEQRSPEGFEQSLKACDVHGKQSPQHYGTSRDVSPTFKITKQQLQKDKDDPTSLESMWKRATSEGRIFEGKLPITLDERRVDTAKKLEGVHISGKPELQLTNIRLEAGKVHVNVSHRPPSSLTGLRGMKRGDAMSAAQP